jgi:hypothetical protein
MRVGSISLFPEYIYGIFSEINVPILDPSPLRRKHSISVTSAAPTYSMSSD